jgi:soluble lytic murein transglycosylase-like protein
VDGLVNQAGKEASVSPDLLRSVISQESAFRPCAVSDKGAMGLMQIMETTASDLGVKNPFDPRENVTAGAKLLKQLINLYNGDLTLALSAYNAGPARVNPLLGIPQIPETIHYVNKILSAFQPSEQAN